MLLCWLGIGGCLGIDCVVEVVCVVCFVCEEVFLWGIMLIKKLNMLDLVSVEVILECCSVCCLFFFVCIYVCIVSFVMKML